MQTGKKNLNKVRYYDSIWGYNYITMNFSWFDGNQTYNSTVTPWDGEILLQATDGTMNQPFEDEDGSTILPTFITTSYTGPNLTSNGTTAELFGLHTLQY